MLIMQKKYRNVIISIGYIVHSAPEVRMKYTWYVKLTDIYIVKMTKVCQNDL